MNKKLASILERAHAEARKMADLAIAEIDGLVSCPMRAKDPESSANASEPTQLGSNETTQELERTSNEKTQELPEEIDRDRVPQVEDHLKKRKDDTYRIPAELFPIGPSRTSDNYELTDVEDDGNDNSKKRRKRPVPEWCFRYVEDVKNQATVDPDTIFGQAPICDLEEMFGKRRRFGRGSSCDWTLDKLSSEEVLAYKEAVGRSEPVQILIDPSEALAN
jgi:hypothetical protein